MSHGGKRPNTGPKKSVSPYGEPTFLVRMPLSTQPKVISFLDEYKKRLSSHSLKPPYPDLIPAGNFLPVLELPLYMGKVSAGRTTGFASPAQDYEQERLDLNKKLVKNPTATYFYYVGKTDDSMIDVGILPGALLIVDRSQNRKNKDKVLIVVDGEVMVKQLHIDANGIELRSRNKAKNYPPIIWDEGMQIEFEGVVLNAVNFL